MKRSPVHHVELLAARKTPVIVFQGDEDRIVPPKQNELMVEALKKAGAPVGDLLFIGEQHGFRNGADIKRSLDAEFLFHSVMVNRVGLRFRGCRRRQGRPSLHCDFRG